MHAFEDKNIANKARHTSYRLSSSKTNRSAFYHQDNRPLTVLQTKRSGLYLEDNRPQSSIQKKSNKTGLPDNLKSGIENFSGYSMNDVKVHYNSSQPAQLHAHAYAQGTDIHIAPGQEKHLPHEAWHVVQQKQGRVRPTLQMKGKVNVNDDAGLEKEADLMGNKANSMGSFSPGETALVQRKARVKTSVEKEQALQMIRNPYGRDVQPFSPENALMMLYDLLDFMSAGLLEDLTRVINLHNAHDAQQAVAVYAHRRVESWGRFIGRLFLRYRLALYLASVMTPGSMGVYFTLLATNLLNWVYERLISNLGEYAQHTGQGTRASRLALGYLRIVEGVEPEGADYQVVRRSGRRSGDTGKAMGAAESMPSGRLSAQQASGGIWNRLSRHFNYEWGHRRADSHRGTNTSDNLGSESMGANSQEMAGEASALNLMRANPGQVRRRNFALRYIGTLLDRNRRITVFLNGAPLITEFVRSDRGPMTTRERPLLEDDYANQRGHLIQFNLRNGVIIPLFVLVITALVRYFFGR